MQFRGKPLTIGNVKLSTNLLLAPIAGYCDLAFRLVARSCGGVGLACTDLLCPEGVLRENKRSMELAATCEADSPLCMQLYGGDVQRLCEAARWAEDRGAHVIDINMGCPVDKITKRDGGSKLLCNPDQTLGMVAKIRAVLRHTPLTCKLRLGWDDQSIVAPYLTKRLAEQGVAAITIHGRTTEMKFTGAARLDGIAAVVAAAPTIPVIGNGDVRTPEDVLTMMRVTDCAGVMIGRAALSQPWLFRDAWALQTLGTTPPPPTIPEKIDLIRRHFYNLIANRTERIAVLEFRKRISWYAKTMHPCKMLRDEMRLVDSPAEFESILTRFADWRAERDEAIRTGRIVETADVDDTALAGTM
jgi:tRNA-dihydrouridine synthase B